MRNTLSKPVAGPEEDPARFNKRRLARWITILVVGILVVLAAWQEPLSALHQR